MKDNELGIHKLPKGSAYIRGSVSLLQEEEALD